MVCTWIRTTWHCFSPAWRWGKRWVHGTFKLGISNFLTSVGIILVAAILGVVAYYLGCISNDHWTWLGAMSDGQESKSTTFRNVGLLVGAAIAILLAVWRSKIAERQADTAQQELLNGRYQKGAEMLGTSSPAVRLGGIYALQRLAEENPAQYHVQIMRLFCAFVRPERMPIEPPDMTPEDNPVPPPADVQAIMDAIGTREGHGRMLEDREKYRLELSLVKLTSANLGGANLSSAQMDWAWLDRADLRQANLSGAIIDNSTVAYASLGGAKLIGTSLRAAGLQYASFWGLAGPIQVLPTYAEAIWHEGLLKADLSGAHLNSSDMSRAQLQGSDLSRANLTLAALRGADLSDTNLFGTVLARANLTGTKFSDNGDLPARGLTQYQLDEAWSDPDDPPHLEGVVDASTGKPLEWRFPRLSIQR